LFRAKEKIFLHEMHMDHVVDNPTSKSSNDLIHDDTSVVVWGSSKSIPIQGIYICEGLFTTQGHLGYDEKMVKKHVDSRFENGLIGEEKQAEKAKEKAGLDQSVITILYFPV